MKDKAWFIHDDRPPIRQCLLLYGGQEMAENVILGEGPWSVSMPYGCVFISKPVYWAVKGLGVEMGVGVSGPLK